MTINRIVFAGCLLLALIGSIGLIGCWLTSKSTIGYTIFGALDILGVIGAITKFPKSL